MSSSRTIQTEPEAHALHSLASLADSEVISPTSANAPLSTEDKAKVPKSSNIIAMDEEYGVNDTKPLDHAASVSPFRRWSTASISEKMAKTAISRGRAASEISASELDAITHKSAKPQYHQTNDENSSAAAAAAAAAVHTMPGGANNRRVFHGKNQVHPSSCESTIRKALSLITSIHNELSGMDRLMVVPVLNRPLNHRTAVIIGTHISIKPHHRPHHPHIGTITITIIIEDPIWVR